MARTALFFLNQPSGAAPAHDPSLPAIWESDPSLPQLRVQDWGVTRGDGVFESIGVVDSVARGVEAHLERFERSARTLDLPVPDRDAWRTAITRAAQAVAPMPAGYIRAVITRGVEGDGRPTGWVYAAAQPDHSGARIDGVSVVVLDRGMRHDVNETSPWLLGGAKTLSYAINRAAVREATRRNASDVVFVSSDGYLLEGPTSSLLLLADGTLVTPPTGKGILEGTTQAAIFRWASAHGLRTEYRLLPVEDLARSEAAWLVSSGRGAAPIRAVDGSPHPVDRELTNAINAYIADL
ncbi:MAG: aminotransferase class IV [Glaciihabitans sp.]